MDTSRSILRSAQSFFAGTLLSRFSGLARDMAMAFFFGASVELAAFFVAYRFSNLFRRLFAENNLGAAIVPHYSQMGEKKAEFVRDTFYSFLILLLGFTALFEGGLWLLSGIVSEGWKEVIVLTMWMAPGLIFICLFGLNASFLECHGKYFIPGVAPVFFNFIWIAAAIICPDVKSLSLCIVLAFFGQWLISFAAMKEIFVWTKPKLFTKDFSALIRPMLLGVIGVGAVQLNSLLDGIFARFADLQGPAYLWYAIRIQQLPFALFAIALSGALLPPLSRAKDLLVRKELLERALSVSAYLMIFCTFGMFALSDLGINLLFGRGGFGVEDIAASSGCLWGYALGLIPATFTLILANFYYAEKDYRTPNFASLGAVIINVALNAVFVFWLNLGAKSIALATSISALGNYLFLSRKLFPGAFFWAQFFECFIGAFSACLITMALKLFWLGPLALELEGQIIQFSLGLVVYVSLSLAFCFRTFKLLWRSSVL